MILQELVVHQNIKLGAKVGMTDELVELSYPLGAEHIRENHPFNFDIVVRDGLCCACDIKYVGKGAVDDLFDVVDIVAEIEEFKAVDEVDPANNFVLVEHKLQRNLPQSRSELRHQGFLLNLPSGALSHLLVQLLKDEPDLFGHSRHLPQVVFDFARELIQAVEPKAACILR